MTGTNALADAAPAPDGDVPLLGRRPAPDERAGPSELRRHRRSLGAHRRRAHARARACPAARPISAGWPRRGRDSRCTLPLDTLLRISAVLGIHKALAILFSRDGERHGLAAAGE